MATTQKLSDVGWIYHAPAKPNVGPGITELPPASQIPGLNEFPEGYFPPEETKKLQIQEHDSPYVRLAKTGGRPDLLRQRTPKLPSKEPKAYPRVNWFYQDDIKMEEDISSPVTNDGPYEFTLPEYMVHQEYKPYGDTPAEGHRARNILSRDQSTVFQREGQNATNKTVKIEESRAPGYGVRQQRPVQQNHHVPKVQRIVKARAPSPELQTAYAKLRTMPPPKEEEKPPMSKILSYGYARDWEEQREQWEQKNGLCKPGGKADKLETEYQSHMLTGSGKPRVPSHGRRAPTSAQSATSQHRRIKQTEEESRPDFFTLSKFKNVPAKTHSHRTRSELLPAQLKSK